MVIGETRRKHNKKRRMFEQLAVFGRLCSKVSEADE